ncbi:CENP-Q, a CENPA-CAD centromere complex subunit-domain-containing protein [Pseudomassariella vexata]|uniref:CENP-Q, a CENPA-CAD centromere complex subunit-domain-containing protein n=1 Tax=Pseudomassariella vexata TaxID=1141098 RepID=A0A1Y2DLF4_9PEZI|nr:CENP-Q, a CENPA-CAD centromere complex subunit-domain-containing protein [Pseudomassariella vexata]ORY60110.1 CENP-Q, a CENPA-CAD centromere complex subunit-domain-containing protein [Pseudomassariella vexata]
MATEAANQKRKRGRPANKNASRDGKSASQTQLILTNNGSMAKPPNDTVEADGEEDARPRKRGRPTKSGPSSQPQAPVASQNEPRKKRGRPSLSQQKEVEDGENGPDETTVREQPKRRGRPSVSKLPDHEDALNEAEATADKPTPKRRSRPPTKAPALAENEVDVEEADDENQIDSSVLRRSGRDRKAVGEWYNATPPGKPKQAAPGPAAEDPEDDLPEDDSNVLRSSAREWKSVRKPSKGTQYDEQHDVDRSTERPNAHPEKATRKRRRPSVDKAPADNTDYEAGSRPAKKKRGRPSLNKPTKVDMSSKPKPRKKGRPTPGEVPTATSDETFGMQIKQKRRHRTHPSDSTATKAKKSRQPADNNRSVSPSPPPLYRHLRTRTRQIPRHHITNKWTALDAPSISSVTTLLQSASRPVLLRLNNLQRHAQATAALNAISNRLCSKLARGLPFPPATTASKREDELEFERTVAEIETLEAQLDPLLHSVDLLKKEKERAERELEREYRVLGELSANARAQGKKRKEELRRIHALVPELRRDGASSNDGSGLGEIKPAEKYAAKTFTDLEDDDLKGLGEQIASHMESMKGNLQHIDGVVPAIADSAAALRMALLPHLDQDQFDQVLFG